MKFVDWHNSQAIPKRINFKTSVRMKGIGSVVTCYITPRLTALIVQRFGPARISWFPAGSNNGLLRA
jgi:hypothetical protein